MSRELKWVRGEYGRWQSAQGDLTLFVGPLFGGWIFWAARTKARRATYMAMRPGLATRETALSAAQSWFDDYLSAPQARPSGPLAR